MVILLNGDVGARGCAAGGDFEVWVVKKLNVLYLGFCLYKESSLHFDHPRIYF